MFYHLSHIASFWSDQVFFLSAKVAIRVEVHHTCCRNCRRIHLSITIQSNLTKPNLILFTRSLISISRFYVCHYDNLLAIDFGNHTHTHWFQRVWNCFCTHILLWENEKMIEYWMLLLDLIKTTSFLLSWPFRIVHNAFGKAFTVRISHCRTWPMWCCEAHCTQLKLQHL